MHGCVSRSWCPSKRGYKALQKQRGDARLSMATLLPFFPLLSSRRRDFPVPPPHLMLSPLLALHPIADLQGNPCDDPILHRRWQPWRPDRLECDWLVRSRCGEIQKEIYFFPNVLQKKKPALPILKKAPEIQRHPSR